MQLMMKKLGNTSDYLIFVAVAGNCKKNGKTHFDIKTFMKVLVLCCYDPRNSSCLCVRTQKQK